LPTPRYVVVANPDSVRWRAYEPELHAFWQGRGVRPEVELVPWSAVVPRDGDLGGLAAFDRPALVRLESPGRDWDVYRLLLQAGARDTGEEGTDWLALPYRKGWLVRPGLLYRGFARVLRGLRASLDARPHLRPLSCPLAVAELFDKNATSARLEAAGVPCPPALPAPATSEGLLEALRRERFGVAYVKLNTGSSASAIAVVRAGEPVPWAVSSVVRIGGDFFSSRRLARHEGADLHACWASCSTRACACSAASAWRRSTGRTSTCGWW
jgi:hypothetical protein